MNPLLLDTHTHTHTCVETSDSPQTATIFFQRRAIMTHASVPEKERSILGISDTLIRLSVGLEDEADIIEDLDQALAAAFASVSFKTAGRY